MTVDAYSLLIGVVIGAAIAFLVKLAALRTLNLKLEKLGIALGVEGFPPQATHSLQTGEISGTVGDIVSGNLDKSVRHGDAVTNTNKYGPTNTLNQYINGLAASMSKLSDQVSSVLYAPGFEHRSQLIEYHFGGSIDDDQYKEIRDIEQQLAPLTSEGWFVSNATILPDYQGRARLWVQLIRPMNVAAEPSKPLALRG